MTMQPESLVVDVVDDIQDENKGAIQLFIQQSYSQAKKQLDAGVHRIHDSVNFIREEISGMYEMTELYFDKMVLPINNFLKDFSQIDTELKQAICNESAYFLTLDGKLVPCEQILSQKMEENY